MNKNMKDCTTCKYGYEDERLGIPMCHHPKRFSEDCVDFNMHEEKLETPNDMEEAAKKEYPCDKSWMTPDMLDLNAHKQVAFRKGAKWQKEQTEKRWLEDRDGCFWDGVEEGKKAMKEQMMKDAVEGEITKDNRGNNVVRSGVFNKDFEYGDKVRIIIVKE